MVMENKKLSCLHHPQHCHLRHLCALLVHCADCDVNRLSGRSAPPAARHFLLELVTCGIYGIYWAYQMARALTLRRPSGAMWAAATASST